MKPRPRWLRHRHSRHSRFCASEEADTMAAESQAKLGQAIHTVDTVDTLMSQRPAKASRVESAGSIWNARASLSPFDAYVTNMNISEGAYAHPGSPAIHAHRHTHLVCDRELSRVQAEEHSHRHARGCLSYGRIRTDDSTASSRASATASSRRGQGRRRPAAISSARSTGYIYPHGFRFAYASKIPTRISSGLERPPSRW